MFYQTDNQNRSKPQKFKFTLTRARTMSRKQINNRQGKPIEHDQRHKSKVKRNGYHNRQFIYKLSVDGNAAERYKQDTRHSIKKMG